MNLRELVQLHSGKVADKWSGYLDEYERVFAPFRDRPVTMLEIGVQNGGSLEIWSRCFPNAVRIVGCDIDPACGTLRFDDPRIAVVVGNATGDSTERAIAGLAPAFDLVIDDGSHDAADIIRTFARYAGRLAPGGLYVVEDLHCSYRQAFQGGLYHPYSPMAFFKRLADGINQEHWGAGKTRAGLLDGFARHFDLVFDEPTLAGIHSVEFLNSMCFIRTQPPECNALGLRIVTGRDDPVAPLSRIRDAAAAAPPDEHANPWTTMESAPEEAWESLRRSLDDADRRIAALEAELAHRDRELADARRVIEAKDAEIESARSDWTARTGELRSLRARAEDLEREARHAQEETRRQRDEFQRLLAHANAFRCFLDQPARPDAAAGPVTLAGWIFHETEEIAELQVRVGETGVAARCALERPDVAARHPEFPQALRSGFQAQLDLPPGRHPLRFDVLTVSGHAMSFQPGIVLHIRRPRRSAARLLHLRHRVRLAGQIAAAAVRYVVQHRRLPSPATVRAALRALVALPPGQSLAAAPAMPALSDAQRYQDWIEANRLTAGDAARLREALAALHSPPRFSVVMPVHRPDPAFLAAALQSLDDQIHFGWQLCAALDGPQPADVESLLAAFLERHPASRLVRRPECGGISACTNSAAAAAEGGWLVFLDQDDRLAPDALAEMALRLDARPGTGVLYTDSDKLAPSGQRFDPEFKPDWSPDLLLSCMYLGHALAVRHDLFESVGGLRSDFDGSQDHDLALRLAETGAPVEHIPRILYHWRVHRGSTASSGRAKPASIEAGRRAVQDALRRRGAEGTVVQPEWAARAALGIFALEFEPRGPAVTLVIPTRNNLPHLRRCVDSLAKTDYDDWRVLIVDDASDDPAARAFLESLPPDRFTVWSRPRAGGGFNYAALVNDAVARCATEFVLLLNDDVEVADPRWLARLMGHARLPGVGAAGAKLLYPDGRVQHAGVILGLDDGLAGHAFKLADAGDNGYLSYAAIARNYSAVTAACLLTRKSLFLAVGGFDADHLAVAYNDADYGLKLEAAGFRCVVVPGAALIHHEGASRGTGRIDSVREEAFFRRKLRRHGPDRFYNPNLSLDEPFRIVPRKRPRPAPGPVRLLAVTPWLNRTGAPLQQGDVVRELHARGEIEVSILSPNDGPLRASYEALGIPVQVHDHPLRRCRNRREYDAIIDRLAGELRRTGAQAAFVTTLDAFFYVAAAHRADIPCIWGLHESVDWRAYFAHLPRDVRHAVGECLALPYRLVFVSRATADLFRGDLRDGHADIIRNGIDPRLMRAWKRAWPRDAARARLGLAPDETAFVSVGTVCERKGQLDLVEAFAALDPAVLAASRCVLVGDRPGIYSSRLHLAVSRLPARVRERIRIVPETDDVALHYRAADVFVCSSRIESYPLTILEAMHMGLPVIATPVFGIPEQIRDGTNGLFYPPGQPAELARAMARLADDPAERARLAANSRPMLRRLTSYADMIRQHGDLIREAAQLSDPSPAAPPPP